MESRRSLRSTVCLWKCLSWTVPATTSPSVASTRTWARLSRTCTTGPRATNSRRSTVPTGFIGKETKERIDLFPKYTPANRHLLAKYSSKRNPALLEIKYAIKASFKSVTTFMPQAKLTKEELRTNGLN